MFLMPGWDHGLRMPPLTITRVVEVGRPCELTLTFRSAPEKFIIVRSMDETRVAVLDGVGRKVRIDPDGDGGLLKLVFAGHEPTFGFALRFSFEQGAVRLRLRIIGAVDGRVRITQENWTGDLTRKATLRVHPRGTDPLLAFDFSRALPPPGGGS